MYSMHVGCGRDSFLEMSQVLRDGICSLHRAFYVPVCRTSRLLRAEENGKKGLSSLCRGHHLRLSNV